MLAYSLNVLVISQAGIVRCAGLSQAKDVSGKSIGLRCANYISIASGGKARTSHQDGREICQVVAAISCALC